MGDGSLLMNVMRQCHEARPNVPLLVCTKEISIEDVRLGLEKLPDRFVEHKNTVFVISNLHYAEAANLKSKNDVKQKKINWNIIKLKGDTSLEFAQQLRKQNERLFCILKLVNDVESRQMAAEMLFGPRPKAKCQNGLRLPFACLRQLFINANIQNYANFSFF